MLRRHPTRVEERPDVADEYEAYLLEKEQKTGNKSKTSQQPSSISGAESDAMTTQQEKRRQEIRARIGLSSSRELEITEAERSSGPLFISNLN
ncbi:Anaphase-promoting complex, subunit CDC26 [Plasmopara halstedii]|uniref:Anaphase-promoting complex, subunit CDC26 n=1 Tax=Plasmopara halstedii TaxID=4781 RepID=A0A0N7L4F1_PLAHL|nr:Anaphase-promoting complex, subunit CDC26 [Plasmopara halstedii]CEG38499.1 Anaphase-promoting complex, subunit CDC26 [Plasmopara halstedii]|eukprot:XP_024574868.1 Anaphase-promoting complex, subunit CDC26 [Plasmopara halstedii]